MNHTEKAKRVKAQILELLSKKSMCAYEIMQNTEYTYSTIHRHCSDLFLMKKIKRTQFVEDNKVKIIFSLIDEE